MRELEIFLERAETWAREAGEIQLSHFRRGGLGIQTKANDYDVVTIADKESEAAILGHIRSEFPDHAILAEESGASDSPMSRWRWVVDPLDGTTNYSQGLPLFSVSIALEHDGEAVVGVVHAPRLGETFTAIRGGGARLNGETIHCSDKTSLRRAVLSTGMPVDRAENPDNNLDNISRVVNEIRGLRRLGSAAIDLCYVGAGFLDGYWELALHRWDVAAGRLIAAEAGADIVDLRPDRRYSVMASAPGLTEQLKRLIH